MEFFIDIKSFRSHYGPGVDSAFNRNDYQEYFHGCKGGRCVRLTTLPPSCAVVMKSRNRNFQEPSGPLQGCNGTALPFYLNLVSPQSETLDSTSFSQVPCLAICVTEVCQLRCPNSSVEHRLDSRGFKAPSRISPASLPICCSASTSVRTDHILSTQFEPAWHAVSRRDTKQRTHFGSHNTNRIRIESPCSINPSGRVNDVCRYVSRLKGSSLPRSPLKSDLFHSARIWISTANELYRLRKSHFGPD